MDKFEGADYVKFEGDYEFGDSRGFINEVKYGEFTYLVGTTYFPGKPTTSNNQFLLLEGPAGRKSAADVRHRLLKAMELTAGHLNNRYGEIQVNVRKKDGHTAELDLR